MNTDGGPLPVDLLDIDEPDEVIAAVGRVAHSSATALGHARVIVGELAPNGVARSPLDQRLMEVLRWFRTALTDATTADDRLATVSAQHAVNALRDIAAADEDGGRAIRRRAATI